MELGVFDSQGSSELDAELATINQGEATSVRPANPQGLTRKYLGNPVPSHAQAVGVPPPGVRITISVMPVGNS